jgi:hypothetical protein
MNDDGCDIPAPARSGVYFPDEIIIYGVKLNEEDNHGTIFAGSDKRLIVQLEKKGVPAEKTEYSIALAYGYAFEGHCYRFDRVRIFILNAIDQAAVGCGFDTVNVSKKYRMWRIRGTTEILELSTSFDLASSLILDANVPGKRAPNTYSATMKLAHRSGRLTQD